MERAGYSKLQGASINIMEFHLLITIRDRYVTMHAIFDSGAAIKWIDQATNSHAVDVNIHIYTHTHTYTYIYTNTYECTYTYTHALNKVKNHDNTQQKFYKTR